MSHDDETVELKRIWTASHLRRQGLARRIVLALEESAGELGYTRAYLSTGFRQPEATALYISLGYRPLFDTSLDVQQYRSLPFEKHIGSKLGQQISSPLYPASASFEEATQRVLERKAVQEAKILRDFKAIAKPLREKGNKPCPFHISNISPFSFPAVITRMIPHGV